MQNIVIILMLIFMPGCSSKPDIINHSEKFKGRGHHAVYVVSHGWHTGFVIDAQQIQHTIPGLKKRFGEAKYIEFGWGDKGFYQAHEITSGLTLRAILWPTESVIHAVTVPQNVAEYFANSEVEVLCMNNSELSSLISFIENSFYRDIQGKIVGLKEGIYGDSQFYKGMGNFYLTNTCNKWTAKGLKSAGMDISPTFKLTSSSVMNYMKAYRQKTTGNTDLSFAISLPLLNICQ